MDEAIAHCTRGIGIWDWAQRTRATEPDVVLGCAGDVPDPRGAGGGRPAAPASARAEGAGGQRGGPACACRTRASTRTGWPDPEFDALFTTDKPVIFAYHGYPWLIHRLTYRRHNHANIHVRGYNEEGTTTTPFDMVMLQRPRPFPPRHRRDRPGARALGHPRRAAPAHARRAPAVQAPRLHPRAGRAGRGRVGVASVGLDSGETPRTVRIPRRGEGPYSSWRPRGIVDRDRGRRTGHDRDHQGPASSID